MAKAPLNDVLHQLMHAYRQLLLDGIEQLDIDLPVTHVRVLKGVYYQAQTPTPCTAQAIAEFMQRDKAQITRALNALMAAKLIVRTANPLDGRSQLLEVTAKGAQIVAQIEAVDEQAVATLTQHLDADALDSFLQISRTMLKNASTPTINKGVS